MILRSSSLLLLLSLGCDRLAQAQNQSASQSKTQSAPQAQDLTVFNDCGMEGDAKRPDIRALNRLKNRFAAPRPDQINPAITLQALMVPGEDRSRWKVSQGATIEAYVVDVKKGGVETCNCHEKSAEGRDTHIELALNPMDGATMRFIVEVTPRWRSIKAGEGLDWSTRGLRDQLLGQKVRVTGWMFLDTEHINEAESTAPGRDRNWRESAWEVHPVTNLEVVR